ncbi:hypothetical protein SCAR479_13284 [Seiridium cardinale]|uniref:Uncharacterized protein n=1 Tax=Seiridium cardinale TaxID=138064 RepID=A0ABR2X8B2_9PEZI
MRKLSDFSFEGKLLSDIDPENPNESPALIQTAAIIDQLRVCEHNTTRQYLEISEGKVIRLWQPRTWYQYARKHTAEVNLRSMEQSLAMAHYLLGQNARVEGCAQCENRRSHGPGMKCVQAGKDALLGAYLEAAKKVEADEAEGHFTGLTPQMLEYATSKKLRGWLRMIEDELQERGEVGLEREREDEEAESGRKRHKRN